MSDEITRMINAAYAAGEEGLWHPGTERISAPAVRDLLEAGELIVVHRDGALAGCVRVRALAQGAAELGLLSAARAGSGIGRELIARAEQWAREHGRTHMRLQLLVPVEGEHAFKVRLHDWYSRLGYRVIGREAFPHESLAAPCDLVNYEKGL